MKKELSADYCIAGGGIAGILLATKLASTGKRILMIDQGPKFSEQDRTNMLVKSIETLNDFADYNDDISPEIITPLTSATADDQTVEWTNYRLFGIGGTALHFEGIMIRPNEEDLQIKSLYGYGRDWPIAYRELEPWLSKAEYEIGVAGNDDNPYAASRLNPYPMPGHAFSYFDSEVFSPALMKLGMTGHSCPRAVNSVPYNGRSGCQACRACKFCPSGARYSPDRVHLPELEKMENVTVIANMSIRKLETNSTGTKVIAAHAIQMNDKSEVTILSDHFIVAMGGVETPRLLLLSAGKGSHAEGLGNMGGQLGQGFCDHTFPYVTYDAGHPVGSRLGFETMISDYFRINTNRFEHPTFAVFASPAMDWFPVGIEATTWAGHDQKLSMEEIRSSLSNMITVTSYSENICTGSTLMLDHDKLDAFGSPVAKITFKLIERDRLGHAAFVDFAHKLGEAMNAKHISEVSPIGFGVGYHPSGATAMAKTPDEGVCDEDLKVFGIDNLYLVSNSVFPHMAANTPTLTITALALRLAAHLKGDK